MGQRVSTVASLVTPSDPNPRNLVVSRNAEAAIFDLDGTLVDSWEEVRTALLMTLDSLGVSKHKVDSSRSMTDLSASELLTVCGVSSDTQLIGAVTLFRTNLAAIIGTSVRLMDGADEALLHLRNMGYTLAVATNKPEPLALKTLEAVGILHHFSLVVGTERFPPKPSPDMLLACLVGTASERGFLVGDSIKDLGAACSANLPVYLVENANTAAIEDPPGAQVTRLRSLMDIVDFVDR